MGVMDPLHQHGFGEQQPRIGMMVPERIAIPARSYFVTQFLQRVLIIVLLKIVDYAASGNSIDELQKSLTDEGRSQ